MTREQRLELLKQIEKDIYVPSIESTFLDDAKSCAIHSVIEELEQEPSAKNDLAVDCVSRQFMYELGATCIATRNKKTGHLMALGMIEELPSVTQLSSELEKNSKLEKIRDQLKSNLRGVEITLEVLVENDPLRPKMEGAKDTLEDCLELIDKAESEAEDENKNNSNRD